MARGAGPRVRRILASLLVAVGALVVSVLAVELALRARPTLLGQTFANGVLTRYTAREGGIYYRDPNLHMNFMIPGLRTAMYYNGYTWTHEADALGFRNRRVAIPAHVVLLGDSMIYGHGVEIDGTVGHFLEQILGRPVANLARQGDSAYQEAYLLSTHIGVYRPRHVVYFYFENDVGDLAAYLSEADMRAFIETPLEAIRYPPRMEVSQALREREARLARRPWYSGLKRAYVMRAVRWLAWMRRNAGTQTPATAAVPGGGAAPGDPADPTAPATPKGSIAAGGPVPPQGAATRAAGAAAGTAADESRSLGWQYTRRAIAYMQHVADKHGARMLVVPLAPRTPRHVEILRSIAADLDLPFLDTSALPADESLWLPGDGHFSPAGARRMAEMVAERLRQGE